MNVLQPPKEDEEFPEGRTVTTAANNDSCLCHSRDLLGGDLQGIWFHFIFHVINNLALLVR